MNRYGFVKVAAVTPILKVANPSFNAKKIIDIVLETDNKKTSVVVFPELCITGYTCGDLFHQKTLLDSSLEALKSITRNTERTSVAILVGLPLLIDNKLYNCAVLIQHGEILGIVPKMFLPSYKEFYEKRWFTSGIEISKKKKSVNLFGKDIPFGNLLFHSSQFNFNLGIEICEDLWVNTPPSSYLTLQGADIIANLSASNELVGKADYRKSLVSNQSARCMCGYVYASAGVHESTTDTVFGGDCLIAENGTILEKSKRFSRGNSIIYAEIDVERLVSERQINKSYSDNIDLQDSLIQTIKLDYNHSHEVYLEIDEFDRFVEKNPFIPSDSRMVNERCGEIFNIQVAGLAKRLEHTGMKNVVIGVSGGLDSTLALLVISKTFELLGLPSENIHGITMPGFGTTNRTYNNAIELMKALNISSQEVSIKEASLQHFKDIGHDVDIHDITYENTQARERTQILMDISNKVGGLVVGTGDLSELALGWCTYNGDHMSMYAVNSSVPKTLVKHLVKWYANINKTNMFEDFIALARDDKPLKGEKEEIISKILYDILDTIVSPELLPPKEDGTIQQVTEDSVGPYELHDFFLYYMLRFGMTPKKILFLAKKAYKDKYEEETIRKWLKVFYKRFFTQQFKRSCMPDGVKVGSISLSPRSDWRMPSDADMSIWVDQI